MNPKKLVARTMQAMVNRDSADPKGCLYSRRVIAGVVLPKYSRSLDLTHRSRPRSLQSLKSHFFLESEDQSWQFGFSGHAPEGNRSEAIL